MTAMTDADLARVIGQLALNYNRPIDDDDALIGIMTMWRNGIGGCAVEDVDSALAGILADDTVRYFPTVADFRRRVIDANVIRQSRAAAEHPDGRGTVACLNCMDSGWLDLGIDDAGYWWLRSCPKECNPPRGYHRTRPRTYTGRRNGPTTPKPTQLSLSEEALHAGIAGTARMQGETVPADEQF
jgi:hypothetical protein